MPVYCGDRRNALRFVHSSLTTNEDTLFKEPSVSLAVRNPTSVTGQLPSHAQVVTSPSTLENRSGESMKEPVRLGKRDRQIAELLLQGCDNEDIAKQLNIRRRTVKAHFNRLFLRFGIKEGIKRVKLAVLLYRRQITPLPSESRGPSNEQAAH
jgi:DNA-binding NarL/FixJ family response regulator